MNPFVTLILPIRNEAEHITRTLHSVLAQDYPFQQFEILVVDGNSYDDTKKKIEDLIRGFPNHHVKVINNPHQYMAMGFNLGLEQARGDVIIMLGGHAEIAPDYISQCVSALAERQVACVGGGMETVAQGWISESIATAMGTPFGVGGVAFRTCPNHTKEVDTVVFAAYRRKVFEEIGSLDEEMIRNQDDEFNYRLREHGGKILFSPAIKSKYYSRSNFSSLWKQYFQYGYWKVRVLQKHPPQMSPRQFAPPVFVLGLLGCGLLFLMSFLRLPSPLPFLRPLSSVIPLLYLLANLTASVITSAKKGWKHLPLLPLVFSILHISYGLGFLLGLVKFRNRWGDKKGKTPVFSFSSEA